MFIAIHNMSDRARYREQLRDCFDLHERTLTPEDIDDNGDPTLMVELANARIDTIGEHLIIISSLAHVNRPGLFLSVNDFSTIEIC